MLIRRGRLPDGRVADIRVDERIVEIADRLEPLDAEQVHRCRRLVPCCPDCTTITCICGRWPRHSTPSRSGRRRFGRKRNWHRHLRTAEPGPDGWIRAIGYHASVAGELDREQLDALVARHAGADPAPQRCDVDPELGCAGPRRARPIIPDGRLHSADDWSDALPRRVTALADITHRLAALRSHRNHRRHTGSHRRRRRDAVGGASARRDSAATAFPRAG